MKVIVTVGLIDVSSWKAVVLMVKVVDSRNGLQQCSNSNDANDNYDGNDSGIVVTVDMIIIMKVICVVTLINNN